MNKVNMTQAKKPKIAVLGDGGWGTTLAILLANKKFPVTLWGAFEDYTRALAKKRVNHKFLPGVKIPTSIVITHDMERALAGADIAIVAIPSQYLRSVLEANARLLTARKRMYVSVVKGIEVGTLQRMSDIIKRATRSKAVAVLSGPTIAHEVATGMPTTVAVAASDAHLAKYLQRIFATERFRVYTNSDIIGVELGGSLKNVIAIACGISDGLGFGTNAKAALLSRGLREISRLGVAMGADARTFSGASGLGDLVTTCISPYSRNRYVGEQIGRGKTLAYINSRMQMVAEGVPTAKSAHGLSMRHKVDMPITLEVYRVLFHNKLPLRAVKDLMTRQMKGE
jgi:glycerol-3-phosphate dehydrogenase (NAD(P)+)